MFDKLIEAIKDWISFFQFCSVVNEYEGGVVLRLGIRHRAAPPGLRFFWPFGIESLHRHPVVVDTQELGEQSLTTRDGVGVVVTGILTYFVKDVEQILLRVQGERQALVDSAMGVIGAQVLLVTWDELISEDFWVKVTKMVRPRAEKYGIKVQQVAFKDLTRSKSLRLWNTSAPPIQG